jgi:hypothetical protein
MKNTEKNSQKSNLFFYLSIFILSFLLIFGGIYLYCTEEERKLTKYLTWINNEKDVEYQELDNNSIVSHNERNILDSEYITKELKHDVKLKPKTRGKLKQVLNEIDQKIDQKIDQEILENKTKEEKEKIAREVLITQSKLSKLSSTIKQLKKINIEAEINNCLKEQEKWLEEFFPFGFEKNLPKTKQSEEDQEIRFKLNKLITKSYYNFIREENLSTPKAIQLARKEEKKIEKVQEDDDKEEEIPFDTPQTAIEQEINKLKSKLPGLDYDEKMEVDFLGFNWWHVDDTKE